MPEPDILDDLLRPNDAAALLGVNIRTVRRWIASGEIRAFRIGRTSTAVSRSDLRKLVRPL